MTVLEVTGGLFLVANVAGLFGALTGLGGGMIIVPTLVLFFHMDIKLAMGASLIAIMATSSGAALTFMKHHYTNVKIGMLLEIGVIIGAIMGALLVTVMPGHLLSLLLGLISLVSVWFTLRRREDQIIVQPSHPWAVRLGLQGDGDYGVYRVPLGLSLMAGAGALSGLLGIGSGIFKVLAMDVVMGLPYKVSTSTSNLMIGMTAATSIGIYFAAGYITLDLACPIILGVLCGSWSGSKLLVLLNVRVLRRVFSAVVLILAIQMIWNGATGI